MANHEQQHSELPTVDRITEATTEVWSGQTERPEANTRWALTAVPHSGEQPKEEEVAGQLTGSPGWYHVTLVLGIPGLAAYQTSADFSGFASSGESLLRLPEGSSRIKVTLAQNPEDPEDGVDVLFSTNSSGTISRADIRLDADDFSDAESVAYDLIMPILSWWCFSFDVAVDIKGHHVLEEATNTVRLVAGYIGREKMLDRSGFMSLPHYRNVLGTYREGVGSTNVFYQVLSFYKVIEGLRPIRARRREVVKASGQTYRDPAGERIPSDITALGIPEGSGLEYFHPFLGKSFGQVIDTFRGIVRNAVAHLDPFGEEGSLVADKFNDFAVCEKAVPVLKYIARTMLLNELQADSQTAPFV